MAQQHPRKLKSVDELRASITPFIPGQLERVPWCWYDSDKYTDNVTTTLDLFTAVRPDKNNGNMEVAGQIPAPQFFEIYHMGIYPRIAPTAIAVAAAISSAGAGSDMEQLLRGTAQLNIASKEYYHSPIWMCPPGGGALINAAIAGTYTATDGDQLSSATNGNPDLRNRNAFWGDVTIPHNQSFNVRLGWAGAVDLTGDVTIFGTLDGYLYRRVL